MSENGQPDKANADAGRFYLTKLHLENFTAFRDIEINFSPGVNVFIGENATGKTHLLKVMYAACRYTEPGRSAPPNDIFAWFVRQYFQAAARDRWNLINFYAVPKHEDSRFAVITIDCNRGYLLRAQLQDAAPLQKTQAVSRPVIGGSGGVGEVTAPKAVYIPVKEMVSHNKGLAASMEEYHLPFEEYYRELLVAMAAAPLQRIDDLALVDIMMRIEALVGGRVVSREEVYYIQYRGLDFELELSLVAEGHRKFVPLRLLLGNGRIAPGGMLFIDEPEANLNPKLIGEMAGIILAIQRLGVQVFLATHSYLLVKELELQAEAGKDELLFHSLYRDSEDKTYIRCQSAAGIAKLEHNPILDAYEAAYDSELKAAVARLRGG